MRCVPEKVALPATNRRLDVRARLPALPWGTARPGIQDAGLRVTSTNGVDLWLLMVYYMVINGD